VTHTTNTNRTSEPENPPDWRGAAAREDPRVELASVRTGLALERTRMNADRTLMAVMRTALALIGFGFVVFEYFHFARDTLGKGEVFSDAAARTSDSAWSAWGSVYSRSASSRTKCSFAVSENSETHWRRVDSCLRRSTCPVQLRPHWPYCCSSSA
jgi:uncharacterized membrane protein YidH (DUF202 family)